LIPCDKFKIMYNDNIPEYFKNHIKKIDPDTKMNVK
jgi:hypothetical protein